MDEAEQRRREEAERAESVQLSGIKREEHDSTGSDGLEVLWTPSRAVKDYTEGLCRLGLSLFRSLTVNIHALRDSDVFDLLFDCQVFMSSRLER